MLYNFGAAILRAVGDTKKPLYFLGISGLANVGLNLLLIIVFHMDVAGVAIGTIVSQAISSVMIVVCLMRKTGMVHLDIRKLRINGRALGEMILIGLPAGVQGSLFSISNVFIQSAVNSFDSSIIVAGNTAANNIEGFVYVAMNAFHQACITFTSQNYGAGKLKNCKKVLLYSLGYVFVTGLLFGGGALLFSRPLLSIYDKNPDVIDIGIIRMSIICLTYFLCGIMDVLVGGLRGLGYSIIPMIVSIIGVCGFRLLWIFTVFENNHTLKTLYISYPISWIATAAIQLICYIFVYNYLRKTRSELSINELN
jgi:Na+-driven multidrug efflux pump